MVWPQPPSPVKNDNSRDEGVFKKIIVPRKIKAMDLLFHWLRC